MYRKLLEDLKVWKGKKRQVPFDLKRRQAGWKNMAFK